MSEQVFDDMERVFNLRPQLGLCMLQLDGEFFAHAHRHLLELAALLSNEPGHTRVLELITLGYACIAGVAVGNSFITVQ